MSELNELDIINTKNKKELLTKSDLKKRIKELEQENSKLIDEDKLKSLELKRLSKENMVITTFS